MIIYGDLAISDGVSGGTTKGRKKEKKKGDYLEYHASIMQIDNEEGEFLVLGYHRSHPDIYSWDLTTTTAAAKKKEVDVLRR